MALWVYNQYNQSTPTYEQQVTDPESMFQVYRSLIELRKNSEVLRFGDIQKINSTYQFLAYSRSYNGKTWIILHNVSASSQVFTLSSTGTIMYTHKEVSVDGTQATLGPRSTLILEVN
jgi:glycosidase